MASQARLEASGTTKFSLLAAAAGKASSATASTSASLFGIRSEIAARLNRDGIPSPSGGEWNHQVFIAGGGSGKGIIGNRIYIGELVWNPIGDRCPTES